LWTLVIDLGKLIIPRTNIGSDIFFSKTRIEMTDPRICQIRPKSSITTHHGCFVAVSGH
jgi:hypothetical protein